jgi:iron(III) transport system substrate-binding protein
MSVRKERSPAAYFGLLPLALCLALVACGGSASPAPASSAAAGSAKPAASGQASGDINLQAVKSEGKVVGYGVLVDSLWNELNGEMQKAYGIPVENFRGDTSAVIGRIEPEEASGQHLWDFVVLESPYQDQFAQKGYIQKLPPDLMQLVPKNWQDPNGYWAAFTLFPQTIIYNTDLVKPADAPQSMDAMADPKWKGKFAMTDPVLNDAFLRQMQMIREQKGAQADEFFKAVAANNPVFFQSGQTTSTNINQGQYPLGLGFMTHVLSVGGKNGHMAYMKQNPMPAINGAFAIAAQPAHPEAVKALERVFLSRGYMEAIAQLGYPVTVAGIQSALPGASDLTYTNIPWLPPDKFNEAQAYFKAVFKK